MNSQWQSRYEVAIEAARAAGQIAHRYFEGSFEVELKGDQSPVTVADRETEQLLREALSAKFPEDGLLGEEHGEQTGTSGFRWIIDPIDGTRNFVKGIPLWGVMVGLEYKDEQIAGVIDFPTMKKTYHAVRGGGAYRNDDRIRVSQTSEISESLVFFSGLHFFAQAGQEAKFMELVRKTSRQRGYGDCYGFALVAEGAGEVMIEHGVNSWDVAASKPIIEEAGGTFTNWDGGSSIHKPDVVVTNGIIHQDVLSIFSS